MKKKSVFCLLVIITLFAAFAGCGTKNNTADNGETTGQETPPSKEYSEFTPLKATNMVNDEELSQVETLLKTAGLDNIDEFIAWVKNFNKPPRDGTGMVETWSDVLKIKYDEIVCVDRWEKNNEESDSDCRMTAFMLLMNHISMKDTIKESGSYLMFDIDAIENSSGYQILKDKEDEFITLFDEIDVSGKTKEEIASAYGEKWKKHEIAVKSENASLISVLMHDNINNVVFVGHTGVLIDLGEKFVFIEKIAFGQPYQVSVFNNKEELRDMFFGRPTYFGDKTEEGPFIYENDKLIFTYGK